MGHPIIDGLLIGAAAGVGANLVNQTMQPGQVPIWTGTCADGTILTVVQTRNHRFEMWAIFTMPPPPSPPSNEVESAIAAALSGPKNVLLGSYPNWVTLMTGLQGWADYLKAGDGATDQILGWLLHNAQMEDQRRAEIAASVAQQVKRRNR
jgi:hypothetical protein